jgi:hypothetical protein
MYRPVQPTPVQTRPSSVPGPSPQAIFFSEKNVNTLQTVLIQDFQHRHKSPLNDQQLERLSKTLDHYLQQVYQKQGDKPITTLNKEVLGACAKDFSQYLQRKEITKEKNTIKQVMDDNLFQETSQRFERLTQERNEVKALPPSLPDFRISLNEDSPPAAELYERAKKQREMEALRSSQQTNELAKAETGLQQRITADSVFRSQQDSQNRNTELALVQRNQTVYPQPSDMPLAVMPDRRDLLLAPVGSFDTMTSSPTPRQLGQANSNPTTIQPTLASPVINHLPQNYVVREDKIVSYREIENNLFIYSADRDWLRNNKENRYSFTVNFDPAANSQSFGPSLAAQQKFKNIVRIELVKAILPGESLDVTIHRTKESQYTTTNYQDNILNLPYISVRVAELENNNYGTDNFLDRSFGVLQYDAQWISDTATQSTCTKGFLAMIPKFLKCQKEYYPTPLSTLQKMTIDLRRPNGELVSTAPDTFDIGGILAPQFGEIIGTTFPFTNSIKYAASPLKYNIMVPGNTTGSPANFYINTIKYFSKFEICPGDRIVISGYTYTDDALNNNTYGQSLRAFCNWINRPEGHIVLDTAYTLQLVLSQNTSSIVDSISSGSGSSANEAGYANFIVIQARYQDPSTGTIELAPFGPDFGAVLNEFGVNLQSPVRLMNLNKQTSLVFRIITREMDSLPQLRPDNNY